MRRLGRFATAAVGVAVMLSGGVAWAGTCPVLGPALYQRTTGAPTVKQDAFSVRAPDAPALLRLRNGAGGRFAPVSSAEIRLNGAVILGPSVFKPSLDFIEVPVSLAAENLLRVELRSQPGSGLSIEVVQIDNEPPTIQVTLAPAANTYGWNNTDVTATFRCEDRICGIASCPAPVTLTQEGARIPVSGTATDKAGNTADASATVSIDKTPPLLIATGLPAPNTAGWNSTDVDVSFACQDSLSGVLACPPPRPVTTEGRGQAVSETIADRAGNTAAATLVLNIDKTPPTLTAQINPTPPPDGWNVSDVAVSFLCEDRLSGTTSCPPPVLFTAEGPGQAYSATVADLAGHTATASGVVNIRKPAGGVDGSVHPELIPDRVAYSLLFAALLRPDATPAANRRLAEALLHDAQLNASDLDALVAAAGDLRRQEIDLDRRATAIREAQGPIPDAQAMAALAELQQQKNALADAAVAALPQRLGANAAARLTALMEGRFKRRVRIVPGAAPQN